MTSEKNKGDLFKQTIRKIRNFIKKIIFNAIFFCFYFMLNSIISFFFIKRPGHLNTIISKKVKYTLNISISLELQSIMIRINLFGIVEYFEVGLNLIINAI